MFKFSNLAVNLGLKTFSIIFRILLYLLHLNKAYLWFINLAKPTNTFLTISMTYFSFNDTEKCLCFVFLS